MEHCLNTAYRALLNTNIDTLDSLLEKIDGNIMAIQDTVQAWKIRWMSVCQMARNNTKDIEGRLTPESGHQAPLHPR